MGGKTLLLYNTMDQAPGLLAWEEYRRRSIRARRAQRPFGPQQQLFFLAARVGPSQAVLSKESSLRVPVDDNPIELAFQQRYGSIVAYRWFGDGYILLRPRSGPRAARSSRVGEGINDYHEIA